MFYVNFIKFLLFVVPFIPLYVSQSLFFSATTSKAFIFRIIVEIVFAAWIFLVIFYKEYRPRKTVLLWAIGFFLVVVTLATILGVNPTHSFWSNFERMEGLVMYLHLFAYFLVMSHLFQKKDWFIFFNLFVFVGLIESGYALFQKLGYLPLLQPDFRVDGTMGNPIYLAAYLIFVLGLCGLLLTYSKNKLARYYYGFVGLFSLVIIYFTASRGAMLAILIGGIIAIILFLVFFRAGTEKEKLYKKSAAFILAIFIVAPILFWTVKDTDLVQRSPVLRRFTALSFVEQTTKSRLTLWGIAWQGFKERPILGWGPENYNIVVSKYYRPTLYTVQSPWFDRPHNIIFDWLISAGILGLFAYLSILGAAVYLIWQLWRRKILVIGAAILISVLLLMYLLQNLFIFDNVMTYISFFTILAYIHSLAIDKAASIRSQEKLKLASVNVVAGILLVPLILIIYFVNAKPLFANLNLIDAIKIKNQDFQGAFEKYGRALSYNTFGNYEIREELAKFITSLTPSKGNFTWPNENLKDKAFQKTITELQKSIMENPLDPKPHFFLGATYIRAGLLDDALKALNQSLKLSPQNQQIYFGIADVYLTKRDYENAIVVLKMAFGVDPTNNYARVKLAAVNIINSQQEKADRLLLDRFGTVEIAERHLVQAYNQIKNYPRLVGIWKAFVKKYPDNLEYKKNLAEAYLLSDQKEEAIK